MHAALNPNGPAPNEIPRLNTAYFESYAPEKLVIGLPTGNQFDYLKAINIFRFLYESGHSVLVVDDIYDYIGLQEVLNEADGFIIPDASTVESAQFGETFEQYLKQFLYDGNRVVVLGDTASEFIYSTTGFSTSAGSLPYEFYNEFLMPYDPVRYIYGFDFLAQQTVPNTLFSRFFTPGRTVTSFLPNSDIHVMTGADQYCVYAFPQAANYCGIWSARYANSASGEAPGSVTFLGNSFGDT